MNPKKANQVLRSIKALAKIDNRYSVNEIRIIVALERAIARLAQNKDLAKHLIFKGGFVLLKSYDSGRFTRDVDALAVGISKEKLKDLIAMALTEEFDDGFWFGDVRVQNLSNQGEYGAYRFDCAFHIGEPDRKKLRKYSRIHIDINFSDRLPVSPPNQQLQSLLEDEAEIIWKVYPIEYILAEKIQIVFDRGSANSRAKDLFDLNHYFPRGVKKQNWLKLFKALSKIGIRHYPVHLQKLQKVSI
ncbi:nucleotidyl transferase AbiEii/AbiGii toxin family protein [bacterium]|nr:nucleotidyl transferase AbiEii/AbiGii toxin family protein [bacterium]MCI0612677.1 nucleotidyl transferase AbiEii/AbiGii toxin family protein [bacterium]